MNNLFLTDENLKRSVQSAKISQENKDALILKIPEINEEERLKLLDVLKEISFLDFEESEAIEKIRNDWEK